MIIAPCDPCHPDGRQEDNSDPGLAYNQLCLNHKSCGACSRGADLQHSSCREALWALPEVSQLIELGTVTGCRAWQLTGMDMDVAALGILVVLPHFAGASAGGPHTGKLWRHSLQ